MGFGRTIIIPIVSMLFLGITFITGIEFPESLVGDVAEFILYGGALGATLYGVVKNHKKEKTPQ
jgi:phosphotransferase system  glucose/maltose/N-acetylglucosamine-specific IIC component